VQGPHADPAHVSAPDAPLASLQDRASPSMQAPSPGHPFSSPPPLLELLSPPLSQTSSFPDPTHGPQALVVNSPSSALTQLWSPYVQAPTPAIDASPVKHARAAASGSQAHPATSSELAAH
jgi:hypothetical protein